MAAPMGTLMSDVFSKFLSCTSKPEEFLSIQSEYSQSFQHVTKDIYDLCKDCEIKRNKASSALPELIIQDFDEEQIWQQLELQNDNVVNQLLSAISGVAASKDLSFQICKEVCAKEKRKAKQRKLAEVGTDGDLEGENETSDTDEEISKLEAHLHGDDLDSDEGSFSNEDDLDYDFQDIQSGAKKFNAEEESFESDESETETKKTEKKSKSSKQKGSIVDDKFFKLADMEAFLDQEDAKEMKKQRGEDEDESSEDEDDVDMFADIPSDDEEEEGGGNLRYEDFFDPPESSDTELAPRTVKKKSQKHGSVRGQRSIETEDNVMEDDIDEEEDDNLGEDEEEDDNEDEEDDDNEDEEGEEDENEEGGRKSKHHDLLDSDSEGEDVSDILGGKKKVQEKSSHEKNQEKLRDKISKMEEASIAEKPWQLAGEIAAISRPENSLLEEHLMYDQTVRLPPVITEETTQTLEEMIKQRIKDKAWDDVERKVKPTENPFEYKKRITLDQEKSKLSLGEIYEQEYLKQQKEEEEEKEDPDHSQIKDMMKSLFIKLDALSNFHYTPKPAAPDVKIVNNLPTISMEEVAPVTHGEGTLLAPEEVKDKHKGETKGKSEKSETDRKRERRQKKSEKRKKTKEKEQREKLVQKLNPGLGNKYSKEKALRDLEKNSKIGKSVTVLKDDKGLKKNSKKLTSSKAFFTQLQEDAKTQISKHKHSKRKADNSTEKQSKKFKL